MASMCALGPEAEHCQAYLALPEAAAGPGVLLLHAWWGLTPFFCRVCERLAGEGFVALAPDLYRGATATSAGEAQVLRFALDDEQASREIDAALKYLHSHSSCSGGAGVVGFSLGGYLALRLARRAGSAVSAVVVFYATEGGTFDTAQAAFLGHFAADDGCWAGARTVCSLQNRLRASGCQTCFHVYPGTRHAFFEQDRAEDYDARAADLAWRRTIAFLHTYLDSPSQAYVTLYDRASSYRPTQVGPPEIPVRPWV